MPSSKAEIAVKRHAARLPAFDSEADATRSLTATRDHLLRRLERAALRSRGAFEATYLPASLMNLEAWYFTLVETGFVRRLWMRRSTFERCFAMYFCEVLVRNADFTWVVQEHAFERGRYEIGVRKGLVSLMPISFGHLRAPTNVARNKKRESVWRDYQRHAG